MEDATRHTKRAIKKGVEDVKKFVSAAYCTEDTNTRTRRYPYLKQGEKLSLYDGRWKYKQIGGEMEIVKIRLHGKEVGWEPLPHIDGAESIFYVLSDEDKNNPKIIRIVSKSDYYLNKDGKWEFDLRNAKYFKRL